MTARRRRSTRPPWGRALALALATVLTACTGADEGDRLLVAAASSVGDVAEQVADELEATRPGTVVDVTTGSTAALAAQLEAGAPFDVLVAADDDTPRRLAAEGRTAGTPVRVATNRLVVVVPPGNPEGVTALGDLASLDVVALCAPDAPCGRYAGDALAVAGVALDEGHVTRGTDARATLTAVTQGGADAGLVYATDAMAGGDRAAVVELGDDVAPDVAVTAVALDRGGDGAPARAYLEALTGPAGRRALDDAGFLPP